jgi:ribosome-associated protein
MGWGENGGDANNLIDEGLVKVNGEVELRKRNKIKPGFIVEFDGLSVLIEA